MVLYPFAELRHRISARPSPSKSPVPATVHTEPYNRVTGWVVLEPADRQITLELLLRLLQRRSDLPSSLKSSLADCATGTTVARNVAMIGITWFRLRTLSDWLADRKSTRLNSITNAHIVCRLLIKKNTTDV